jgi:transcriptional regulator with XRE-family HTH domain
MKSVEGVYREIGLILRARRLVVGMTQGQLAAAMDMSRPSIVNIEQGRQRLLIHTLYDFAAVLHTSPAALAPAPKTVLHDYILLGGVSAIDSNASDAPE